MSKSNAYLATAAIVAAVACTAPATPPSGDPAPIVATRPQDAARYVDPFIGTANALAANAVANGASGATFPGAAMPFGLVQWSPDTPSAAPPGYAYEDREITGFSLTHLNGAGCPSLRDFPVLPFLGAFEPRTDPRVAFTHDHERAWPGFYEVTLDNGVLVQLTASPRAGLARFTFPANSDAQLLISAGPAADQLTVHGFELHASGGDTLSGHRDSDFCGSRSPVRLFMFAKLDRSWRSTGAWYPGTNGAVAEGEADAEGFPAGVALRFDTSGRRVVQMRVGLSYTSVEAARANLEAEIPSFEFDAVRTRAEAAWTSRLSVVETKGGTDADRTSLFTALYHSFLQPAIASDVDGKAMGMDGVVREDPGHARYVNFSGWDIYRSWIQLLAVLAPDVAPDIVRSLVAQGRECGALPKWSFGQSETGVMIGDPSDAIVANAHAFGVTGFDTAEALALMRKGAEDPSATCNGVPARKGLSDCLEREYCPVDSARPASGPPASTLEYAIADSAIAHYAFSIGQSDVGMTYARRAMWWKNTWNPDREALGFKGFPQPREKADKDGAPVFRETDVSKGDGFPSGNFTEGNAAQYTFLVPQDPLGLIRAVGGEAEMVRRLDALFEQVNAGLNLPHFYIGNEPSFGTPWLYAWTGAPSHMQAAVRRVVSESFRPVPSGLPGNDDLGATSSWLTWAMLGLYPAVPGVGGFVLASPVFEEATLRLPAGTLVISAPGARLDRPYTSGVKFGEEPLSRAWIDWATLQKGGRLAFTIADGADDAWATGRAPSPFPP